MDALAASQKALAIRQKLRDAQPTLTWLRSELAGSLITLGAVQRRACRPADAAESPRRAIALVEQLPTLTPRNHYSLACCHALLAGLAADKSSGMTAEKGMAEAEQAMEALRLAMSFGYGGIANLRTDASLDVLRPRDDFQQLVKEMEAKVGAKQKQ
jgi:hypothetical protein